MYYPITRCVPRPSTHVLYRLPSIHPWATSVAAQHARTQLHSPKLACAPPLWRPPVERVEAVHLVFRLGIQAREGC
jgi:hypothetical protein